MPTKAVCVSEWEVGEEATPVNADTKSQKHWDRGIGGFPIWLDNGCLSVIIQRWSRTMGTVADIINDTAECVLHKYSKDFLVGGVRARAFRMIQTTNFIFTPLYAPMPYVAIPDDDKEGAEEDELESKPMFTIVFCPPVIYGIISRAHCLKRYASCYSMELHVGGVEFKVWIF